jgi:hypothetical protein
VLQKKLKVLDLQSCKSILESMQKSDLVRFKKIQKTSTVGFWSSQSAPPGPITDLDKLSFVTEVDMSSVFVFPTENAMNFAPIQIPKRVLQSDRIGAPIVSF